MTTIYGIKNCDTVKKARQWLDSHKVSYVFHDFRKDGLEQSKVIQWLEKVGADALINKRGTTWKQLAEPEKMQLTDNGNVDVICNNPTLIKRPVIETGRKVVVGFKESDYQTLFKD